MSNAFSFRSVLVAVLSFPLVACASFDGVSGAAYSGGGSGGSPLAGSPSFSADSVASNNAASRTVTAAHDASPRSELRFNEVRTCRQCK